MASTWTLLRRSGLRRGKQALRERRDKSYLYGEGEETVANCECVICESEGKRKKEMVKK